MFTFFPVFHLHLKCNVILKGSYDVAKKNIYFVYLCNVFTWFMVQKTLFSTYCKLLLLYASAFLKHVDFYKACLSEKWGQLWLASYPVCCDWPNTSSVRWKCYVPHRVVMAFPGKTRLKQIKPITNEEFVASSGDIDYNDLYCLFITMSAFVFGETTNKHYSTPIKKHVWIVSRRNVLAGCELEAPDCPCKVGIALLYRNSLCASLLAKLLFQLFQLGSANSPP